MLRRGFVLITSSGRIEPAAPAAEAAGVAELADALDLGSSDVNRGGSNPPARTMTWNTSPEPQAPIYGCDRNQYRSVEARIPRCRTCRRARGKGHQSAGRDRPDHQFAGLPPWQSPDADPPPAVRAFRSRRGS